MRVVVRLVMLVACLAVAGTAGAQFGHPLKGSWSGDWGPNKDSRTRVLVEIAWDGKVVNAVLNPGPNGVTLKTTLNENTWAVKFEGDGKDRSGAVVHYALDGKLENIGAFQRFITGSWTQGSAKGEFKLIRN